MQADSAPANFGLADSGLTEAGSTDVLQVDAYAKLNLTFEVLGWRDDGYHEVCTVMQTIDLADRLEFAPAPYLSLECDFPGLAGRDNLVWRAAEALARAAGLNTGTGLDTGSGVNGGAGTNTNAGRDTGGGINAGAGKTAGARIRLVKRIPPAMGLGGGSSDAAATLLALNRLWGLDFPETRLAAIAAGLGSDVPFFLRGGTALAEGRGERITPLPPLPPLPLTLAFPDMALAGIELTDKTRRMYSRLTPAHYSDGGVTRQLLRLLRGGEFADAAAAAGSLEGYIYNAFQPVAEGEFPALAEMRRAVAAAGGPLLHLCGAGPALFAIAASDIEHRAVAETLQPLGVGVYRVHTIAPPPPDNQPPSPP